MKKLLLFVLASALLLCSCLSFSSCASKAPKVEDIYDRVVELVEASNEVNTVFYGAGLPVYAEDSVYAEFSNMYYNFKHKGSYEMVTGYAKFLTVSDIRYAAEQVYSKAYLEDVLYPSAFEGHAISGINGAMVARARYLEDDDWIYQSTSEKARYSGMIVYDYSTMRIVAPINDTACYVEMDAWGEDTPSKVTTIKLRLVKEDNGLWYLDSFTGGVV